MEAKVAVVGAGVIGLSTAYCIANKDPNIKVTVVADMFSPDTCSDGAAGIILPYIMADTPIHLQRRWFQQTVDWLKQLLKKETAPDIGLSLVSGNCCFDKKYETPGWNDLIPSFRELSQEELEDFPPCVKYGYNFTTPFLNNEQYLPWLAERFQELGGVITKRTVESLAELSDSYDVVVNCSGMRARDLVGDKTLKPVRGQVLRVKAPSIKQFFMYDSDELDEQERSCYILPQINEVVLGGTKQLGNFSETPTAEDTAHILKVTSEFVPSLKRAKVLRAWVGLRPSRPSARVEKEVMTVKDKRGGSRQLNVVHNYGHGGSGLTVHWGCALDSSDLVLDFLTGRSKL